MPNRFYGEFSLVGDNFSPDEITKILKITPSRTWKKGDYRNPKNPDPNIILRNNGWEIKTKEERGEDSDVEEHIISLLNRLKPLTPKIKRILSRNKKIEAIICCVVYTTDVNPQIYFKPDVIKRISDMGASIWFDVYKF